MLFALFFSACGENSNIKEEKSLSIKPNLDYSDVKRLENVNKINLSVSDTSKEAFLIFTNISNRIINIKLNNSRDEDTQEIKRAQLTEEETLSQHAPRYITEFNHLPINENSKKVEHSSNYLKDSTVDKQLFYLEKDLSVSTQATVKKNINIKTKYGKKTLNVWVSDDSFGEECSKKYCIEQSMIDKLTNSFLKDGDNNDIYDWVSNIFGEEWGKSNSDSLIDNNREITILLTDIDSDNIDSGGVLGYFYGKDNYKKTIYSGSNERTMFYIDSVVFASHRDGQEWNIEDYKQKKILSTLAHEFEHMIQFYQKKVKYNSNSLEPWIDEMLAVTVEDIIATKLKSNGLRGVSYTRGDAGEEQNPNGRFPLFNNNINLSLPTWNNRREDYSKVGAFGSYLVRNYGGAKLLHDILHNRYSDEKSIIDAIQKSPNGYEKDFDTLIHEWGVAVLLSSSTDINIDSGYLYNLGDFLMAEYKDTTYSMGSINFFNYSEKPKINSQIGDIEPKSNMYYKIETDLKGDINITFEKNKNIITTLIIK